MTFPIPASVDSQSEEQWCCGEHEESQDKRCGRTKNERERDTEEGRESERRERAWRLR